VCRGDGCWERIDRWNLRGVDCFGVSLMVVGSMIGLAAIADEVLRP
jgi:hypothetical protein